MVDLTQILIDSNLVLNDMSEVTTLSPEYLSLKECLAGRLDTVPPDRRKVCIEVTFSTEDNPALESEKTVIFHSALVSAVIRLSGISHRRLDDAQVVNSGSIVYYIEVKPQYNASDGK